MSSMLFSFLVEIDKKIQKVIWKCKIPQLAKQVRKIKLEDLH